MSKPLTDEQLRERRANLAFIRENVAEGSEDHTFTTTLIMQEEWLATVADLQAQVERLTVLLGIRDARVAELWAQRDEANRQLVAVAEMAVKPARQGERCMLCKWYGEPAVEHDPECPLADLPAAAQEIGARLERAEKLEKALGWALWASQNNTFLNAGGRTHDWWRYYYAARSALREEGKW